MPEILEAILGQLALPSSERPSTENCRGEESARASNSRKEAREREGNFRATILGLRGL